MDHYQDSFIYLGGMHGYNVSRWLISQVGVPGVWMILLITAICFFIYISARTVIWLRKLFALSFLKREKKEKEEVIPEGEGDQEFTTSQPQEVEFNLKRTYKQTPPPAPVMDIQAEEPEDEFPLNQPDPEDSPLSDESGARTSFPKHCYHCRRDQQSGRCVFFHHHSGRLQAGRTAGR